MNSNSLEIERRFLIPRLTKRSASAAGKGLTAWPFSTL